VEIKRQTKKKFREGRKRNKIKKKNLGRE